MDAWMTTAASSSDLLSPVRQLSESLRQASSPGRLCPQKPVEHPGSQHTDVVEKPQIPESDTLPADMSPPLAIQTPAQVLL